MNNSGNFLRGIRKGYSNDNFINLRNQQKTSLSPPSNNLRQIRSKKSTFDIQN